MKEYPVEIRPMRLTDIPGAMRLKNAEGWNQTEKDWEILVGDEMNIKLVAEAGERLVGTVTAINYANAVAWIGMMIVGQEFRGQGIGKRLMEMAIKKLRETGCRAIKLDATPAGQPVYKRIGFVEERTIYRLTNFSLKKVPEEPAGTTISPVSGPAIREVVRLDEKVFGANRKKLLQPLVKSYPRKSWLLKAGDQVSGFALGRKGVRFQQVGPVSAATTREAIVLIRRALKNLGSRPVVVDILADKKILYDWLISLGFTKQRQYERMYLQANPFPGITEKQFLICGAEFG